MFPGKYFSSKYFASSFWTKTGDLNGLYSATGDIKSRLIGAYLKNGDVESFLGVEFSKVGDCYGLVLKRPPQSRVSFTYDIQSQIN